MRTLSLNIMLAAALLLLFPSSAFADMYVCQDRTGGPPVWTNDKDSLNKRRYRCRLSMKTGFGSSGKSDKRKGSGSSDSGKPKPSNFKPPKVGDPPRPVVDHKTLNDRVKLYVPYIDEAAAKYQIPAHMIRAVMRVESRYNYKAVSSVGAQGLMQLMPKTARQMGVNDAFDPRQNIMGGARLLRWLANRHDGDIVQVLSAYHAGTGAVSRKGGIPYEGTEGYVRAVLNHYYRYKDQLSDPE